MNRKTIRKYNKKHKTIRRAIRRTRKGGDVKDFRDKMFTKFGRQSQAKTEFKSLLRRMEKLGLFRTTGCQRMINSFREKNKSINLNDFLLSKIERITSTDDDRNGIIDALMQLGNLYLKYPTDWRFKSDLSDAGSVNKNDKYNCVMELGQIIGNKLRPERSDAKSDMYVTDIEILLHKQTRIQELLDDTQIELDTKLADYSKSKNEAEYIKLRKLIVNYTGQISCIKAIIEKIRSSGTTDIADISSTLNCVDYRFNKNLEELLQEATDEYNSQPKSDALSSEALSSEALSSDVLLGGSRRRRMNTHRRGKHTRRYKPKK